jgi:hypothetical protein
MNKKDLKVSLTNELSEEIFFNALCNSLDYMCSGYGLDLKFKQSDYNNAKAKLSSPCYEDVLMQMLRDGVRIELRDITGGINLEWYITLDTVHERVKNVPITDLLDMIDGNDDAVTGDVVLQIVFLNEIMYG